MNSSFSACTTWQVQDQTYYLLDVTRGRYDFPRLRELAIKLAKRYSPDVVLIEDTSTGTALAQELRGLVKTPVKPVRVHTNKVERLFLQQRKFEAGQVRFPESAAFLAELEAELLAFPHGKHDDQVDSITQALSHEIRRGYNAGMDNISRFYERLAFEPMLRSMAAQKGR